MPTPYPDATAAARPAARHPGRIVVLVENLPVPPDRRVWQESTALARAGHSVTVICPKGKGYHASREVIDGVEILRYRCPEALGFGAYLLEYTVALLSMTVLCWRVFMRSGFDVIQACNPPDLLFLVAAPFKLFGVRFVFDHHDLGPELFAVKFGERGLLHRLMCGLERVTLRLADHVLSPNSYFRRVAMERGGKKPEAVDVVLSAPRLAADMDVPPDPALRRGRRHAVMYVGVMGSQDGVDLLLAAAADVVHRQGRSDVQFLLAGDGPERPALMREAERLGLTDHVTFLGFLTGSALWRVFRTADIGVCPDPKNGFNDHLTMCKLLEYMAFGLPCVAFDLTMSVELVGDAGRFAGDNDPVAMAGLIAGLLDDPAGRQARGAAGRARFLRHLSWDRQAETLVRAYDRVLAPKGQPLADANEELGVV